MWSVCPATTQLSIVTARGRSAFRAASPRPARRPCCARRCRASRASNRATRFVPSLFQARMSNAGGSLPMQPVVDHVVEHQVVRAASRRSARDVLAVVDLAALGVLLQRLEHALSVAIMDSDIRVAACRSCRSRTWPTLTLFVSVGGEVAEHQTRVVRPPAQAPSRLTSSLPDTSRDDVERPQLRLARSPRCPSARVPGAGCARRS